jgi:pantetheine-phosphate adenylyltransferase
MSDKVAVFPGSFDPITVGHTDLIERAASLFDHIIVAIGVNSQKKTYFTLEQRMSWLNTLYGKRKGFSVASYEGLTVKFCERHKARVIIRGVRNAADFDYERTIALLNTSMDGQIETVLLPSAPQYSHISSTIVRELIRHDGNYAHLVPPCVTIDANI